jgi:tetratricopeptide (TPR) repeat protein
MTPRFFSVVVALGLATVSTHAYADAKADAQVHIAKAQVANDAGKYTDALNELNTAYTLDPDPQLLYAIGQVHAQLGQCDEAKTFYQRFLDTKPDKDSAAVATEAMKSCKSEPVKPPPPVPDQPPPPPPPSPAPAASSKPIYSDVVADALVGGGVLAGLVAVFEYKSALGSLDDADHAATFDARKQLEDDAHGKRTLSVVFALGGIALIGGGVAHYMLHRDTASGVAIVPTSGGGMVTFRGGF